MINESISMHGYLICVQSYKFFWAEFCLLYSKERGCGTNCSVKKLIYPSVPHDLCSLLNQNFIGPTEKFKIIDSTNFYIRCSKHGIKRICVDHF